MSWLQLAQKKISALLRFAPIEVGAAAVGFHKCKLLEVEWKLVGKDNAVFVRR